jgi:hypothetical protein
MTDEMSFLKRARAHFAFLEEEYGYQVTRELNSPMRPRTDGAVEYRSASTAVAVDSEHGCAGVCFYRAQDEWRYHLTPVDIHEYLNTSEEEKRLLLSTVPADSPAASVLANKILLLRQPGWQGGGTPEDLERTLGRFAAWTREHAALCVAGDLSQWPAIQEYCVLRSRAACLRRGESELVRALVLDADGKPTTILRPIYHDQLEHVERLKREIPPALEGRNDE